MRVTPSEPLFFADGFSYNNNQLTCDGLPVPEIISRFDTPTYLYNINAIGERFQEWKSAFGDLKHQICFAVKSNSSLAVLQHLVHCGCSFDVNSRGELFRVLRAGAIGKNITMTGVGKMQEDIEAALKAKILFLHVESLDECMLIDSIAARMNSSAQIILRLNPEVDAQTHPYIATGLAEHKFGIAIDDAREIISHAQKLTHVTLVGFGMHIGSQILDPSPYVEALEKILSFIERVQDDLHHPILYINIGGGIGVRYMNSELRMEISDFINALQPLFKRLNDRITIVCEPGRHLTAHAGILLTKVLYVKKTKTKNFIIVDAGMNDLLRPTLYEAHHEIHPVEFHSDRSAITADIVGPVCETGDYFALDRTIDEVKAGECLAIFSAGAYGSTMSSRYNSRPLAAEVVVRDGRAHLARERESCEDMIRLEKLL